MGNESPVRVTLGADKVIRSVTLPIALTDRFRWGLQMPPLHVGIPDLSSDLINNLGAVRRASCC